MVNTSTRSGKAAFAAALTAAAVGVSVLAGWMFDLEYLKRIVPGFVAMNPATAAAFIFAGTSLALFLRSSHGGVQESRVLVLTARGCALLAALIGLAKLAGVLCGWGHGVDQWLFASKLANGLEPPNGMAPNSALNFLLLGGALVLADAKSRSVRFCVEFAAAVVGFVSLLAVLGYAYDIQSFYRLGIFIPMAPHTAVAFSILSAGFLLSHTDSGLLAMFAGESRGGKLARRLLPAAILVPAVLGWLARLAESEEIYDSALCDAAEAVGNILVFTFLICWTAQRLFNADNRSKKAEEATRESEETFAIAFEHAPIGVALLSSDGQWLKVNQALCDLVGYSKAELLARTFQDITLPEEMEAGRETMRRLATGEARSCELRKHYVHRRGHLVTVSIHVSVVRDGQGQPRYFVAQTQDITERERAEAALRESKHFLRGTLDALSSHIAILDEHGVIVEVNAAWDRFAGLNGFKGSQHGLGANYLEVCDSAAADSSEDAAVVAGGIRAVIAGKEDEFQWEYPCHGPREQRWYLVLVTRFGGAGPARVVVAHENVTGRKQAEVARNESQLRYRSLFEHMLEGYAYCQLLYEEGRASDYLYLEVNGAFEPLTGLKNVVGKKVSVVVPGMHENNPEQLEIYSRVAATGIPEKFETYAKGLGVWFSVSVYSHEKEHFVAVFDNITGRKGADQRLRFDEQRYRSLVQATTAIVWDTPASGEFEVEQPGWTALTGQSFEELRGWGWLKAIHPDDQAETGRAWAAAVENRSIYKVEHRLRARDGTYRHMMVRAVPVLAEDGTIHQWIGIHSDITERKQAEAELRWKTAFLEAQVNSSGDGILVVDGQGRNILQNQRRIDLFEMPRHIVDDQDHEKRVRWVADTTTDPEGFMRKVARVRAHPDEVDRDEIELKNGTFIERYTSPVIGEDGTRYGRLSTYRDITARKRTEESLRLLGSAVEQSRESILITDAELDLPGPRIVFVNPAFTRMTGYTAEEVIGKTPRIFQGPRTDGKVMDRLRRTLEAGEVFDGVTINYRKDGSEYVLEWQIAPIREANGPITHFVAIERDITERTRSEALLLESQQRLALATGSAHIGIWDWNVVENKMVWDARMLALYGLRPHEFTGAVNAWQNGLHPQDRERVEAEIAAALAGTRDFQSEFRVVWPSGETHDIQAHGVVQRAADGSAQRMIGINWDVTARRRSEGRYRRLVESNVQGVLFWTATGGITGANDAFLSLVGYNRADLEAGRIDWMAMTPPEYAPLDRRVLEEIAARGSSALYEKEYTRKDGSRVPILFGATAFEDNPEEGVCFVVDLTERKRLEALLFQSQKLETVGKLAGGIAHEFNSILTAIIGQSELLLTDLPAGSPLVTNATEITKAAGRAADLTRQLLAYGRKQLLQPEALDLNRVVTGMEGVFRHLMGDGIDTRIVAAPGLRAVKADAGQLEQVIMNMAINARDAMSNGGIFTLETAHVSFDQESVSQDAELKPGGYVMLAISDTGAGMSAEVKARLFEPFFSTKGVGQGTGLGLSTCYGIIKQSGGHISVHSELARGTVFKIYLPQIEPLAKAPVTRVASPGLPGGTETILLVEDDSALREMAAGLLRRLGYTILAAGNGIEALSLKQQRGAGHVDLLLTDAVMPQMSGKELAERVLALSPRTRILFTSAYTGNAIAHQDILDKNVAVLQKPFLPSVLARKLREVLDQPDDTISRN